MSHTMHQQSDVLSETWGMRCVLQNANTSFALLRWILKLLRRPTGWEAQLAAL